MHRSTSALLLAVGALIAAAYPALAGKLPANIKRCARVDPNVDECLRAAVQDALPKLKHGLPKLGLHPLDPLVIQEMRLSQGGQGPVNLDLTFRNMTTTKILDGVRVLRAKFDADAMRIEARTVTPAALAVSDYTVNGHVLVLPIVGSGLCRVDLYNITTNLVIKGKKLKRDGKEYFDVTEVEATLAPTRMQLRMENLFNGDKQLGDTMNRVLSDNWELVFNEIGGSLNQAYSELFKRPAHALFHHVPLDEIHPQKL